MPTLEDILSGQEASTDAEQNLSPAFAALAPSMPPQAPPPAAPIAAGSGYNLNNLPQGPAAFALPVNPPPGSAGAPQEMSLGQKIGAALLTGLGARRGDFGVLPQLIAQRQRAQIAQQEMAIREKQQTLGVANAMANIMQAAPGFRGPLLENYARLAGMDPKDPDLQNFIKLAKGMDDSDAAATGEMLKQLGMDSNSIGEFLSRVKDPNAQIRYVAQLQQNKKSQTVDQLIKDSEAKAQSGFSFPPAPKEGEGANALIEHQINSLGETNQRLLDLQKAISSVDPKDPRIQIYERMIDNNRSRINSLQSQVERGRKESTVSEGPVKDRLLAAGINPATASPAQVATAIKANEDDKMRVAAATAGAVTQATQAARPLDSPDRLAIDAMESNLNIARQLKANFTSQELRQYVGFLNRPVQQLAQLFRSPDSPEAQKFALFENLTNQAKGIAFQEGGKNLTRLEAQITFGHLPTGSEFNFANYISNLDQTISRSEAAIKRREALATTPRSQYGTGASALPAGVPQGSTLYGRTGQGKPVYQAPDGKRYVVE